MERKVYVPVERPASVPARPKPSYVQPTYKPTPALTQTGSGAQVVAAEIARNMVRVAGGSFQMGSSNGDQDEKPVHTVRVGSFSMSKYEVTQRQWEAIMGTNPSSFKNCPNCPVETVSWEDTQEFLDKLNRLSGKSYRLPTEAEWEYAARGGSQSQGYEYSGSSSIDVVGWYSTNSEAKIHPVGQKLANELGLYDLSGNVYEWCSDWYGSYSSSSSDNPTGASNGASRVLRGGSWDRTPAYCRSAYRSRYSPSYRRYIIGFRVVAQLQ